MRHGCHAAIAFGDFIIIVGDYEGRSEVRTVNAEEGRQKSAQRSAKWKPQTLVCNSEVNRNKSEVASVMS